MNMEPVEMVLLAGWDHKTLTQTTIMAILIERWLVGQFEKWSDHSRLLFLRFIKHGKIYPRPS
jgi:hypothetical protein